MDLKIYNFPNHNLILLILLLLLFYFIVNHLNL
jgi:hypothetical protein